VKLDDTIVAVSTPHGRGGLGVVRLSGSHARTIAERILRFPATPEWRSWRAMMAELIDDAEHPVDQVVATYFQAPRSYTSEDVIEISCHGSPVVLRYAVERAVQAGARLAEPGEFTMRAFVKGRIDLPQAEAVRDLIEATTLYQARVAAQQAGGSVSRRVAPVKSRLLDLIALLEAGIDFADDDVDVPSNAEILTQLEQIEQDVRTLLTSFAYGKLVHDGLTLAIVGKPNVGKSSLFNRLLKQDRAIVAEIAGTTRDAISEVVALEGIPVKFVDTAGIRPSGDLVESLGIERSHQAMADADLTLVVVDLSAPLDEHDAELIQRAHEQGRYLLVGNKCDLEKQATPEETFVAVSALTGDGIAELRRKAIEQVAPEGRMEQEGGFLTSIRQEQALQESRRALEAARAAVAEGVFHEMLLLDLYAALQGLDSVTGATTADDILNRIFSNFCIGK